MKYTTIFLKILFVILGLTLVEFYWPTINQFLAPIVIIVLAWDFKRKKELHWLFIASIGLTVFPELQVRILGPLQIHHVFLLLIGFFIFIDWLRHRVRLPSLSGLILVFIALTLTLTLLNFSEVQSWHRFLIMLFMFLITLLAPYMLDSLQKAKQLFAGLWATALASSAFGLAALYYSVIHDSYFFNPYLHISTVEGVPRLAGTLLDSNFLGHFLLLVLPLGFILLIYKRLELSKKAKLAFGLGLIFLLAVFFLTYSRSAYLGLGAALILIMFLFAKKSSRLKKIVKIITLTFVGLAAAALLYPSFIYFSVYRVPSKIISPQTKTRIMGDFNPTKIVTDYRKQIIGDPNLSEEQRDNLLARDVSSDSLGYRISFWRAGLAMFRAHPFTGVGIGQFRYNYAKYGSSNYLRFPDAHNIYIELLAESGIFGFALFVLIIVAAYKQLFRLFSQSSGDLKLLSAAVLASLTGILVQSSLLGGLGAMNLYLILGLAVALPRLLNEPDKQ